MTRAWLMVICRYTCMAAMFMIMGCAGVPQPASEPGGDSVPKQLQSRQVIVTLAPASPERWAYLTNAIAQTYDLPQVGAFPLTSLGVQCVVFQIPDGRAVDDVIAHLAADPRVETVQINQTFQGLGAIHNDPYATLQYGAQAIRADVAHRWATGKGVTVAVVDTGVDTEHADLHGRIVKAVNFVERGERTFAQDRHGTAVAGVTAARADNEVGIFGIAPEADIVAVKACWQRAPGALEAVCSSWTLARAVDFTIQARVQVLNLSLADPPDPLLARLITKAVDGGIAVIAAALEEGESEPRLSPVQVSTLLRATAQAVKVASSASQAAIGQVDACNALGRLLGQPICP